jgi:gentisate 1,2-dioxygenase
MAVNAGAQAAEEREAARERYYAELPEQRLWPLWKQLKGLLPSQPTSRSTPCLWPYDVVRAQLMRAGELVTAEEAERRALMLMNPGLDGKAAAAGNLYAALQLILPGEVAPAHRHGAAALRFVIEGSGAYTAVEGEKTTMRPGDLVLTPSWAWHDHGNETDEPMIWLDGLDLPLINALEANFFESYPGEQRHPLTRPDDASAQLYASGRLNPTWTGAWSQPHSPILNYPWSRTEAVLRQAAAIGDGSPWDGVRFEYVNPITGGPTMPTIACYAQLLAAGRETSAHRHTSAAVYHVVRGCGHTLVDGVRLEWGPRDTFAVPGWAVHRHAVEAGEDATLFSFDDAPVHRALGLYREAAVEDGGAA